MKKQWIVFPAFALLLLGADLVSSLQMEALPEKDQEIEVSIQGSVVSPGTYRFPYGITVEEALKEAGVLKEAETSQLNPLWVLKDKDVLYIPEKAPEAPLISINTATKEELMQLSGIGEKIAQAIVDYREAHGLFQTLEDLLKVKGIGEKKLAKIREKIRL